MEVFLSLFGRCQLFVDGVSVKFATQHSRALLAYLAMQPGAHERALLAALLWPNRPEATARQNLRQALASLKNSLRPFPQLEPLLVIRPKSLELQATIIATDAQIFSELWAACAAHTHPQLVACEECIARFQQAAQLYTGEFLHGLFVKNTSLLEEWMLFLRERFHRQVLEILDTLTRHAEFEADYSQMRHNASRQLALEPWSEEAHRQLMRAMALSGQSTAALAHYAVCQRALAEEFGILPSPTTTALYEQIKRGEFAGSMRRIEGGPVEGPAIGVVDAEVTTQEFGERSGQEATKRGYTLLTHLPAPHNLPSPLTPFIGREQEVDELIYRLAAPETRLLTLVGLGGIGKTRLAIEAAMQLYMAHTTATHMAATHMAATHMTKSQASKSLETSRFTDGFFFISLAPLSSSSALAPTIAATLGIDPGSDPQQTVIAYLRNKAVLLILDNFEHLLAGVPFVVEVLEQAPHVKIVVTSRERLNVRGEHLCTVPPLTHAQEGELTEALTWSAVRLFAECARRESPNFKVTESNLPALLRICGMVQAMPLGLEMAAAWCGALSLDQIAAEIERSIDFLVVDYADLPERQRSIRTIFAWSWRLLDEAERRVLCRITLFRGGFTLHAAQAVAGATLPILIRLVNKLLLQWQENPTGGGRYAMHELLRQFAAEELDATEYTVIEEMHAHYYLAFVAEWGVHLGRGKPKEAGAQIQTELDNVRQAWQWAARGAHIFLLEQASYGWWQFCHFRGLEAECRSTFALAVEGLRQRLPILGYDPTMYQQGERLLSKLLALYANYLFALGQWERMAALAQEAIALGQASGGLEGEAFGYFVLGRALQEVEQQHSAKEMFGKASETAHRYRTRSAHSEFLVEVEWMGYSWLKGILQFFGDHQGARACMEQALHLCRSLGKLRGEMACLINLALNSSLQGDYTAARQEYEQAIPRFRMLGSPVIEGSVHYEYGEILRLQGAYIQARGLLERAVTSLRACASSFNEALTLVALVRLHCQLGDIESAGTWRTQLHQLMNEQELTGGCRALGFSAFAVHGLLTGDYQQAQADAEQGWLLAERHGILSNRADAAVVLGHARSGMEDWDAAATAYRQAVGLYRQVGNVALTVEAQAGLAQIALVQDDRTQAQQLVEAILPMLNENTCGGCYTPFFIWLTAFHILTANQDPRAVAILQRGHELLQIYADAIPNAGLRRSFLEQVRPHRALQRAYAKALAHS